MASSKTKGRPAVVDLDKITIDPDFHAREDGVDDEHADNIAEAVKGRQKIKPPTVFDVDGVYLLTRGRHRYEAYKRAGRKTMPVLLRHGTRLDAMLDAAAGDRENLTLPLRREDKRKVVRRVFEELTAAGENWSNSAIAEQCGVSHEFVRLMRPSTNGAPATLEGTAEPEVVERSDKDGKKRKVKAKKAKRPDAAKARAIPLQKFLNAEPRIWVAIRSTVGELTTVGEMIDHLAAGATFGLRGSDIGDLKNEFADYMQYATRPGDETPKPGTAVFDWGEFAGHYGRVIRDLDGIAASYPNEKNGRRHKGALKLMGVFVEHIERWKAALHPAK